jgi:hypothetical protein
MTELPNPSAQLILVDGWVSRVVGEKMTGQQQSSHVLPHFQTSV